MENADQKDFREYLQQQIDALIKEKETLTKTIDEKIKTLLATKNILFGQGREISVVPREEKPAKLDTQDVVAELKYSKMTTWQALNDIIGNSNGMTSKEIVAAAKKEGLTATKY